MTTAATLKETLAAVIAAAECNEHGYDYEGIDWDQLLPEEERVFAIDWERWPRMIAAWHCYEAFMDLLEGSVWDSAHANLLARERARHPELFAMGFCLEGFARFAKDYAGLTNREAHAVFAKQEFHNVRFGVMFYRDEREADSSQEDAT